MLSLLEHGFVYNRDSSDIVPMKLVYEVWVVQHI